MQLDRIRATADAINARIPADFTEQSIIERLERAFRHILSTHKHQGWPSVAVFVEAMDYVAKDSKSSIPIFSDIFSDDGAIDPLRVAASRIRNRLPVGEVYLSGPQAQRLIEEYGITEAQLSAYRRGA